MLLWLYAAVNKLLDFQKFKVQLGQSPMLTDYAVSIAWIIPNLEVVIALFLVFNTTRLPGLYFSFAMMLMFTAYIAVITNMTDKVPCHCGGILGNMGWTAHLVFNLFFAALAFVGIVMETESDDEQISPAGH